MRLKSRNHNVFLGGRALRLRRETVGTLSAHTVTMLTTAFRHEHRLALRIPTRGLLVSKLSFSNATSVRRPEVLAPWHEIVVCLGGECIVSRGRDATGRLLTSGTVVGINPGERYAEEHFAAAPAIEQIAADAERQVQASDVAPRPDAEPADDNAPGLIITFGLRDLEALGFADFTFGEGAIEDETFVRSVRELVASDGDIDRDAVVALLRTFIERHGKPVPGDKLFAVKREIDRQPHAPLYVAQLAEMASMHPETFTRAFARRFGITPIRYRLHRRLLEAAHLLLTEPHMLVSDVATRVGFEDLRFFHRSFRGRCGISPAAYRQWFSEAAQGRRRASGIPPKNGEVAA